MPEKLIYFALLIILFCSCEEIYTPAIEPIDGKLVVEALITNDVTKNFVRLTKTSSFYNKLQAQPALGAKVDLVEINGNVVRATEGIPGVFSFSTTPVEGKNYMLRITYLGDNYESEIVTMPPLPSYENFYTENIVKKIYRTDSYGVPNAYDLHGQEVYIDLPVSSALSHYRFETRSVSEWVYSPPGWDAPPPPPTYGWQSFIDNTKFNVAGPKKFSQTEKIEKHPLVLLPYKSSDYLESDSLVSQGWILIIDQYGTSKGSFDYREELNSQFAAKGSLFDPIQTQVYGNITCKSYPPKNVYGYFELNSYRHFRYFIYTSGPDYPIIMRQIFTYPDIPYDGKHPGFRPDWWQYSAM